MKIGLSAFPTKTAACWKKEVSKEFLSKYVMHEKEEEKEEEVVQKHLNAGRACLARCFGTWNIPVPPINSW